MNGLREPSAAALSTSERRVLEQVYTRQSGHLSPRALAALVARGFVLESEGSLQLSQTGLRALQSSG
jgi:hypothetical protein